MDRASYEQEQERKRIEDWFLKLPGDGTRRAALNIGPNTMVPELIADSMQKAGIKLVAYETEPPLDPPRFLLSVAAQEFFQRRRDGSQEP